jgi:hypothetical protein
MRRLQIERQRITMPRSIKRIKTVEFKNNYKSEHYEQISHCIGLC